MSGQQSSKFCFFLYVGIGASVTQEKTTPRKKNNMKSLATSPIINDPIQNQDIKMLGTKKYQSIPSKLAEFSPGYKSLINEAEDGRNDSTDTSPTDKEDYVNNLKAINEKELMTNTKMKNCKITTVMKVLSTKLNNKKYLLNG